MFASYCVAHEQASAALPEGSQGAGQHKSDDEVYFANGTQSPRVAPEPPRLPFNMS